MIRFGCQNCWKKILIIQLRQEKKGKMPVRTFVKRKKENEEINKMC